MYFSAICLSFCAFYIHSACCGLVTEKLKLSQVSEACPPGVWTCSTGKRSEIAKVEDRFQTVERRAVKCYPPGIWTRDEQFTDKEDPESCPPGMCVDKKKRMLKQMLKIALKAYQQDGLAAKIKPSQVSDDACPPGVWTCSTGVWTCSTGKRSEIPKVENRFQTVQRRAVESYPPGIWTRDEQFTDKEDPESCPPGMRVEKKKRMLKQMLKIALKAYQQDGLAAKIKPSQVSDDACPPGVWTCSTGKRSEIAKVEDLSQTVQRRAVKSYPPGIWTRDEQFTDKADPKSCPPGMCVDKKKRMLKHMLKIALKAYQQDGLAAKIKPFQASDDACPPGVWTCSTGKRSEIAKEGQVEALVLDESHSSNIVKEQRPQSRVPKECGFVMNS